MVNMQDKIRDLFKVKLNTIRKLKKGREREKKREKKSEREGQRERVRLQISINPNTDRGS